MIVSHGSPIAASHLSMHNRWMYVGQCTLSITLVEGDNFMSALSLSLSLTISTCRLKSVNDKSHLSQQTYLHETQSKRGEHEKAKEYEANIRKELGSSKSSLSLTYN